MNVKRIVEDATVKLIQVAETELPPDVKNALHLAYRQEDSQIGKQVLRVIMENIKLAEKLRRPICQDTGLIIFYATLGHGFGASLEEVSEALISAVKKATLKIPLRPNIVHPFSRRNTTDNVGRGIPWIYWNYAPEDFLELTAFPKGAGSENMCALSMLKPTEGLVGVKKFVVDTVIRAGGQSCPPIIVGVGVGGNAEAALSLAEKALLRPINRRNKERLIAKLEEELLNALNATGIGPMGLGGRFTALGVNVEYSYCHTASLPVGVNIQCWAARRATARIYPDGRVEMVTQGGE